MTELKHGTAEVNGVKLHWAEQGSGPLVVLLHGFPEFWYSWRHQLPALAAAGFHAVAVDLRGYNGSEKPRDVDAYRISTVAEDIAALIRHFGGGPAVVFGHDWGGVAAWFLPMLHPDVVRKLVVLNSPHPVPFARELRRDRRQRINMSYQLFFQLPVIPELLMPFLLRRLMARAGRFTREDLDAYSRSWRMPGATRGMANYYRAMLRHRQGLRQLIRPIEAPTLLIWGERDPVFTRATTENFGEYVPNLRIERIAKAGHFVQTDAAERVNELLIDFLR